MSKKMLFAEIDSSVMTKLRLRKAQENRFLREIVEDALRDYLGMEESK